ncbi:hypothetical protein QQ045_015040 [Rhodiola kirilowii]
MIGFAKSKWGREEVVQVTQLKPGIFLFNFISTAERDEVLDLGRGHLIVGPWCCDTSCLILTSLWRVLSRCRLGLGFQVSLLIFRDLTFSASWLALLVGLFALMASQHEMRS